MSCPPPELGYWMGVIAGAVWSPLLLAIGYYAAKSFGWKVLIERVSHWSQRRGE